MIVISTKKGIEGIELINKVPPFIIYGTQKFIKTIIEIIKNNKDIKKKSVGTRLYYLKKYSMKNITQNFIEKNLEYYSK